MKKLQFQFFKSLSSDLVEEVKKIIDKITSMEAHIHKEREKR
jgi:hypothetical protein